MGLLMIAADDACIFSRKIVLCHKPKHMWKCPRDGKTTKPVKGTAIKMVCSLVGVRYHLVSNFTPVSWIVRDLVHEG